MNAMKETVLFGCAVKYNNNAKYETRLATFLLWPKQIKQDKFELARAGFIYTEKGDTVECFACGVKISEWDVSDIPAVEHEKHSSECHYMKLTGVGMKQLSVDKTWSYGAFSSVNFDI